MLILPDLGVCVPVSISFTLVLRLLWERPKVLNEEGAFGTDVSSSSPLFLDLGIIPRSLNAFGPKVRFIYRWLYLHIGILLILI